MRRLLTLSLVSASLVGAPAAYAAPLFTGLGDLPGGIPYSSPRDVSDDGSAVVGVSYSSERIEAYRWTQASGMVPLGVAAGGSLSAANGVSEDGSVVVGTGNSVALRWSSGTGMVALGDLPGGPFESQANAISDDAQVIVGQSFSASGREAFLWTQDSGMLALGDLTAITFSSTALGASSDGSVIVGGGTSSLGEQAFRWTAGDGMVGLPQLPGGAVPTEAMATSGDGSIVVGRARFQEIAFIWDAAHGTRALADVLEDVYGLDLAGWTLEEATGISADGFAIVGLGTNPSGDKEAFLAIIPEPSTALLFGAGLVGLALKRRLH